MKQAVAFLEKKDKVKVNMVFQGREMSFRDQWKALLEKVIARTSEVATLEKQPLTEGRIISMVFAPKTDK